MSVLTRTARRAPVFLSVLLLTASAARSDDAALQSALQKELQNPAIAHGWTGILIQSLKDGRTVFSLNEDRLFIPASNQKLLVSAVATDRLPPDFRYTTPVHRDGTLQNGVLKGNLYLKGSGDPTLESAGLKTLAQAVRDAGITRVTGDIVGDGSIFDDVRLGYSWSWDDLPYYYSAEIDGLTVDRGTVAVKVMPGEVGAPAVVTLENDSGYVLVRNTATTVADSETASLSMDRPIGSNVILVSGKIKKGSKGETESITMKDPAVYTAYLFRKFLRDSGVAVDGGARRGITPDSGIQVAAHTSPSLPEILRLLNKPSDNLIAEHLLKTLGVVKSGKGSFRAGIDVERDYLKAIGVGDGEWLVEDGSGLSRLNMLTPQSQVKNLAYMWTHKNREGFLKSLPVAGVDGSLRSRMKGTPAEANVKAKTGYVGKARTLSGYVTTKDGEPLAFSLMMNHYNGQTSDINAMQDRICVLLASHSS